MTKNNDKSGADKSDDLDKSSGNGDKSGEADKSGGDKALTPMEMLAKLSEMGVTDEDLARLKSHSGSTEVEAYKSRIGKEKADKDEEKRKTEEEEERKRLEKAGDLEKALAIEKKQLADEKAELQQRECRVVLTAKGFDDIPEGVFFGSKDAAVKMVDYLLKLKPVSDEGSTGRPDGTRSPKEKTKAEEFKENSNNFLKGKLSWLNND